LPRILWDEISTTVLVGCYHTAYYDFLHNGIVNTQASPCTKRRQLKIIAVVLCNIENDLFLKAFFLPSSTGHFPGAVVLVQKKERQTCQNSFEPWRLNQLKPVYTKV